jgi:hypothetical protein
MLSMVTTAILLLLAVLILAGPLLEEFIDWLMPPGGRRLASRRHSGIPR